MKHRAPLLVQLEADNADGQMTAGSYADVHFDLPATTGVDAVAGQRPPVPRAWTEGATLGADNHVVLKKYTDWPRSRHTCRSGVRSGRRPIV